VKICEKCCRMIRPDEPYTTHDKTSMSAGGLTVYIHKECPPE